MPPINLENLRQVKNTPNALVDMALITLSKIIRENVEGIFCFCEGKDARYYGARIKEICTQTDHPISCGSKWGVQRVHFLIQKNTAYTALKKAFFVDKDFDLPLNNLDIYETPCYSLENLYANTHSFSDILKREFSLNITDDDYKKAVLHFENRLNEFNDVVLLLNAWYACQKDHRNVTNIPIAIPSLGNKIPNGFVSLSFDEIKANYTILDIENLFSTARKDNSTVLEAKINDFNQKNDKSCVFRGKFQMEFFAFYLATIAEKGNQKIPTFFKEKRKNHLSIHKESSEKLLSSLAQYAVTPPCLREYLVRFAS